MPPQPRSTLLGSARTPRDDTDHDRLLDPGSLIVEARTDEQVGGGPEDGHEREAEEARDVVVVGVLVPPAAARHVLADRLEGERREDAQVDGRHVHELRGGEELGELGLRGGGVGDGREAGGEGKARREQPGALQARLGHVARKEAELRLGGGRRARLA